MGGECVRGDIPKFSPGGTRVVLGVQSPNSPRGLRFLGRGKVPHPFCGGYRDVGTALVEFPCGGRGTWTLFWGEVAVSRSPLGVRNRNAFLGGQGYQGRRGVNHTRPFLGGSGPLDPVLEGLGFPKLVFWEITDPFVGVERGTRSWGSPQDPSACKSGHKQAGRGANPPKSPPLPVVRCPLPCPLPSQFLGPTGSSRGRARPPPSPPHCQCGTLTPAGLPQNSRTPPLGAGAAWKGGLFNQAGGASPIGFWGNPRPPPPP